MLIINLTLYNFNIRNANLANCEHGAKVSVWNMWYMPKYKYEGYDEKNSEYWK